MTHTNVNVQKFHLDNTKLNANSQYILYTGNMLMFLKEDVFTVTHFSSERHIACSC